MICNTILLYIIKDVENRNILYTYINLETRSKHVISISKKVKYVYCKSQITPNKSTIKV